MKLVLASNNQGKLKELQALFSPLAIELVTQSSLDIPEAEEPYATFIQNALTKAQHAARLCGLPAVADDAGFCIEAFGGQPGVDTKHYGEKNGYPAGDEGMVDAALFHMQGQANRRYLSGPNCCAGATGSATNRCHQCQAREFRRVALRPAIR